MPELPEVETICQGLRPALEGQKISAVTLKRPDLRFPFAADFTTRLQSRSIEALSRRAKYILAHLDSGDVLAIHLGMTGRFSISYQHNFQSQGATAETDHPGSFYYDHDANSKHDHVIFTLTNGARIAYNDVRRFGYMSLIKSAELAHHPHFKDLGPEPLSKAFGPALLINAAGNKIQPLKAFLLDQKVVAGLGNIYVCEALFRAKLHPEAPAKVLADSEPGQKAAQVLCRSIKDILNAAIKAGGSTLRDYRHADGAKGAFQEHFSVYDREGEACLNSCGGTVQRSKQQGRSSFFCPTCQRVA